MQSSDHQQITHRYNGIAIGLHWLIAILIIGLLMMGKYMTQLDETDAFRFELTQWHKSFGISVLVLSICRLVWRLMHRAPPLPTHMPRWERAAAGATHVFLYFLMLGLPLSGWIMVSASPLNIDTLLFNLLKLPHLPPFAEMANRAEIAELFHTVHEMASGVLIVLLLLHIGAALRHQFVLRDQIMSRISFDFKNPGTKDGLGLFAGVVVAAIAGTMLFNTAINAPDAVSRQSGAEQGVATAQNQVNFTLTLLGENLEGQFGESEIIVNLDENNIAQSSLRASVVTATADTGTPQVDNALPGADWFSSDLHPVANFESSGFSRVDDDTLKVEGMLTIRETSLPISFPLVLNRQDASASGGFTINRLDYAIGAAEQPDDSQAGFNVLVEFEFKLP